MSIEHRVELDSGAFANTSGPYEQISAMYPSWESNAGLYVGEEQGDGNGVVMTPFNGVLRFKSEAGSLHILGNTVTRLCPVADSCGSCALSGAGLDVQEMSDLNCARANTAVTFAEMNINPESRFVLLPLGKKSLIVDDSQFSAELSGGELLQNRLAQAPSVVFTKSWLAEKGHSEIAVAMNGADGSMGVATVDLEDEQLIIAFCSMRDNMGDRTEQDQILRQALNAYFDSRQLTADERAQTLSGMKVSVTLSASASLQNFAHHIQIPREDLDAPEKEKQKAATIRDRYPELLAKTKGVITSAIVLESEYPGALARGSIFPEFEAKMGIHTTPITPDNCPGDGQACHVDYRTETRYSLITQLENMGIPADNISYDDTQALDPASPDNNMASNRAEQNNGVATDKTNRTINAMKISL